MLSTNQKRYIRNNYRRMKVSEIARNLMIAYDQVRSFKTKEHLEWDKFKKPTPRDVIKKNFFNVNERRNWLA